MADLQNNDIPSESGSINKGVSLNTYLTYSFINNSMFYPLLPGHLLDYYNRFVRRYLYWYDGFDPLFHTQNSGIFSTRLAYTLCNKLAKLTVGNKIMLDEKEKGTKELDGKTALQVVENWLDKVDLTGKARTTASYMFAGGDAIIKMDSAKKMPYPTVLRKDNYYYTSDFSDKIIDFTGLIYSYTSSKHDDTKEYDYYYILEERKFDENDKPVMRIYAKIGKGNITSARDVDLRAIQPVAFEKLPRELRKSLNDEYPDVKLGKWTRLPFKDSLGIYLFKNSESISMIPQINMGESLLSNIMAYLMSYDFYFSALNTDLYNGRGRVILPKGMQNPEDKSFSSHFSEMQDGYYNMVDYIQPENQKPTPIQFDLRANDWATISKILLRGIAMSLGISERTITQSLTEGTEKSTAREVSMDDATSSFVTEKRYSMSNPFNCMLRDVLDWYGFKDDEVTIRFSRVGLTNMNEVTTQMTLLKQNGLVDIKTALEFIYVDKNDKQIEEMVTKIKEEREKEVQNTQNKQSPENFEKEQDKGSTTDEGYEQKNNDDISHVPKKE